MLPPPSHPLSHLVGSDYFRHPKSREFLFSLACAALIAAVGPFLLTKPLHALGAMGLFVLLTLVVTHPRLAVFVAMAGLTAMEEFDLSSSEAFFEGGINTSLLGLRILGVSFMDVLTLLFLVPTLAREWKKWYDTGRITALPSDRIFLPMVLVYFVGATQGWFTKLSFSHYSWEARDLLYIMAWYFTASRTLRDRRDVRHLILIVLGVFSAKSLLFVYRSFAGQGLFYGYDYYRVALGSDVPMMALPFLGCLAALVLYRDKNPWIRILLLLSSVYWTVLLLASLGRSAYLLTSLSLVVTAILMRKEIPWKYYLHGFGLLLLAGTTFYWLVLGPVHRELASYVLSSAFNWVDAIGTYGDLSIGQRALEAVNIFETLNRAQAWVFGLGWGAPWTEIVIKHPIDKGSFPLEEQLLGIHTSAHIDALYFLLKLGVTGTLILYASYLRFFRRAVQVFRNSMDRRDRLIMLVLVVFLVMVVPNYVYFIKLKCLLGVVLGCVALLDSNARTSNSSEYREQGGPSAR